MPYSTNPARVLAWKSVLDELLTGAEVHLDTDNSHLLAHALREAIYAAKANMIKPYSNLNYSFGERPGKVICRPIQKPTVLAVVNTQTTAVSVDDVYTPLQFIAAMTSRKDVERVTFPNYTADLTPIQSWAAARGYTVVNEAPLTLVKD